MDHVTSSDGYQGIVEQLFQAMDAYRFGDNLQLMNMAMDFYGQ